MHEYRAESPIIFVPICPPHSWVLGEVHCPLQLLWWRRPWTHHLAVIVGRPRTVERNRVDPEPALASAGPGARQCRIQELSWGGHGERAEREPITGVWGWSPQWGPGAEPLVRDQWAPGQGSGGPWSWKPLSFRISSGSGKNTLFSLLYNHNKLILAYLRSEQYSRYISIFYFYSCMIWLDAVMGSSYM